jgi:hypothetical protein
MSLSLFLFLLLLLPYGIRHVLPDGIWHSANGIRVKLEQRLFLELFSSPPSESIPNRPRRISPRSVLGTLLRNRRRQGSKTVELKLDIYNSGSKLTEA